ncbi:hypothetical protein GTP44_26425 [Duganella sp. FT50W]|uniref:Uncharacterized protein n=1 Tax=Duganella lactea TaxID=2692173 RepID=A0A6L8MTY5_9BURK|nr:hypothetical protein [Duganella lactea]MYM85454.1 hypothetical protein [Duganella lactea]
MSTQVNLEIALEKLHQLQHEDGDLGATYWYEISCLLKEASLYKARALAAEEKLAEIERVNGQNNLS